MRPVKMTDVHKGDKFAELVCSNSLKSMKLPSAAATLKEELKLASSYLLRFAEDTSVPAGGALAVDRELFAKRVTDAIEREVNIDVVRGEVTDILQAFGDGASHVIVATGPLTSDALGDSIVNAVGEDELAFYDAAAPIVMADSLDMDKLFVQSRYDDNMLAGDYLNAPMTRDEYDAFIDALLGAERVILHDFESKDLFQACQPAEEIAKSGHDSLRHGAMKPVGLTDPKTGRRPWACVQLRAENAARTAYNLVGFQTNLTFGEQKRVFSMIPGLRDAEFARYGVMHRNTFIDAPHTLDATFALKSDNRVRFAGQITGTEGYTEAIASGLLSAVNTYAALEGRPQVTLPKDTVFGALVAYATDPATQKYQPMHVNYGIMPPLEAPVRGKRDRYAAYSERALSAARAWLQENSPLF
jgi:methylenetetrahydrofolate--tRNA-(uracil-5-)-methyltransferase